MVAYATVETALARMHDADPEAQRGAFRGRMKHLQRLGLPLGEKPGKGKRIDYSEEQIIQLALALELAECGLDPVIIANMIDKDWHDILLPYLWKSFNNPNDCWELLLMPLSLMSSNWKTVLSISGIIPYNFISISSDGIQSQLLSNRRYVVINVQKMMTELYKILLELSEER